MTPFCYSSAQPWLVSELIYHCKFKEEEHPKSGSWAENLSKSTTYGENISFLSQTGLPKFLLKFIATNCKISYLTDEITAARAVKWDS